MLGHVVARYLAEQGFKITTVSRKFRAGEEEAFLNDAQAGSPDWVVNCAAVHHSDAIPCLSEVNCRLPATCAESLDPSIGLIHASSDGVFVPWKPCRSVDEAPDAQDSYGLSKRAAEEILKRDIRSVVIRCSIIGPEISGERSLLSWFLSRAEAVNGYVNHCWNGITTLEWASICAEIIRKNVREDQRIVQPGTWPPTTKYDVLRVAGEIWNHPISVRPAESARPISRSLLPSIELPPIPVQLRRLEAWY